jgi:hypothetical protein
MSMNPDDRLVNVISTWLGGRIANDELQRELDALGTEGLGAGQAEAIDELRRELDGLEPDQRPGQLEMVARETLEAVALGG